MRGARGSRPAVSRQTALSRFAVLCGGGLVLAGIAFTAGCAALAPLAVKWGADLVSSASQNYSQQYSRHVEGLLLAIYSDEAAKRLRRRQEEGAYPQAQPGYPPSQPPYGPPPGGPYPEPYPQAQSNYPAGPTPYGSPQSGYGPPPSAPYPAPFPTQPQPAYPTAQSPYGAQQGAPGYGGPTSSPYPEPYPQAQPGYSPAPLPYGAPGAAQLPGGQPGYPAPQGGPAMPIVLDAAILAQRASDRAARRSDPVPIQDGEVLRDGGSDPRKGDVLKFSFRVNCDCYVYVIGADATGYIARVFPDPASRHTNPVRANEQYVVPEGTAWYGLDQYKGVEQVFFIASRAPRQDIENSMNQLTPPSRGKLPKDFRAVREAIAQDKVLRGLVKVQMGTQSTVQTESGRRATFVPQAFVAQTAGDDVVVTRWFNHE